MSFSSTPTTTPMSSETAIHYLTHHFSDELIELSQMARYAPLGLTDSTLTPGWYFTIAGHDSPAYIDTHSATPFTMRNFVTIFQKTLHGRIAHFALGVTLRYDTQEVLAHWIGFTPNHPDQILDWPDVWARILFAPVANPPSLP